MSKSQAFTAFRLMMRLLFMIALTLSEGKYTLDLQKLVNEYYEFLNYNNENVS